MVVTSYTRQFFLHTTTGGWCGRFWPKFLYMWGTCRKDFVNFQIVSGPKIARYFQGLSFCVLKKTLPHTGGHHPVPSLSINQRERRLEQCTSQMEYTNTIILVLNVSVRQRATPFQNLCSERFCGVFVPLLQCVHRCVSDKKDWLADIQSGRWYFFRVFWSRIS